MNITELDQYNLADAVKFNDELNPRLWDGERLRPDVRAQLLTIAKDFQESLGVPDLQVHDITISGSNASYSYTSKSDIDLHLVADVPQLDDSEIYAELFSAKKYQYNNEHSITIKGHDVEVYVQNPAEKHHSQGIYSIWNDSWVSIPKRRRPDVDDLSVRAKYDTLAPQIEDAVESGDYAGIVRLADKIRDLRRAGLEQGGEFSPENLVFKMLRSQGYIDRLYAAKRGAKDDELSLEHITSPKDKRPEDYGRVGDAVAEGSGLSSVSAKFRASMADQYPGAEVDLYAGTHGGLTLSKVAIPKEQRKTGTATAIIKAICQLADEHNAVVALTPSNDFGASKSRLIDFYKRFGFVMNKGRQKDYQVSELMYRPAKEPVTEAVGRITKQNQTKDVGPNEIKIQARKFGNVVSKDGVPEHSMLAYSRIARALKESYDQAKDLNEVNMSPGALAQWSQGGGTTNVVMGFEAELVVSNGLHGYVHTAEDTRVDSIDDFKEWYAANGGRFSWSENKQMDDDYDEWLEEAASEYANDGIDDNDYRTERTHDWAEIDYSMSYTDLTDEQQAKIDATVETEINDKERPYRIWRDEKYDELHTEAMNDEGIVANYFRDRGWSQMSDLTEYFSLDWPSPDFEDNNDHYDVGAAESIGEYLSTEMGIEVIVSDDYHGDEKDSTSWYIEPDASITPSGPDDLAIEIVSPPMPFDECVAKMTELFDTLGHIVYTNQSTGFHMSLSIPGREANLDYVKLILFLGDRHVLAEFGRLLNSYAKAVTSTVAPDGMPSGPSNTTVVDMPRSARDPNTITSAIDQLRRGMAKEAASLLIDKSIQDAHYTVASRRDGYVEFRAAGNSDYQREMGKLIATAQRYARAMSIASDPAAEVQEYYKKLYKMLSYNMGPQHKDAIALFANYAVTRNKPQLFQAYKMFRGATGAPPLSVKKYAAVAAGVFAELSREISHLNPEGSTRAVRLMSYFRNQAKTPEVELSGLKYLTNTLLTQLVSNGDISLSHSEEIRQKIAAGTGEGSLPAAGMAEAEKARKFAELASAAFKRLSLQLDGAGNNEGSTDAARMAQFLSHGQHAVLNLPTMRARLMNFMNQLVQDGHITPNQRTQMITHVNDEYAR